jgi:hypothetical protein
MAKIKKTKEVTATSPEVLEREYKVCTKVDKLSATFGNGELNQVVEKINEIIEVINKCQ